MATKKQTKSGARNRSKESSSLLNRREAAFLADVPLRAVDKAIEEKVARPRRARVRGTALDSDDTVAIAVIAKAGVALRPSMKKQIRSWTPTFRKQISKASELALSNVVVVRPDSSLRKIARSVDRYLEDRERYIESNLEVRQGEPVIVGTRLPVYAVAERLRRGDSIEQLAEDYPGVPKRAFQTARIYAEAHPRRGRPARPWREVG
jgi:uncharacterized protein (DUF433 family)